MWFVLRSRSIVGIYVSKENPLRRVFAMSGAGIVALIIEKTSLNHSKIKSLI